MSDLPPEELVKALRALQVPLLNPASRSVISQAAALIERLEAREKLAFTFAFARGFQIAEETSRSCISAMDDAWEDWAAFKSLAQGEG